MAGGRSASQATGAAQASLELFPQHVDGCPAL